MDGGRQRDRRAEEDYYDDLRTEIAMRAVTVVMKKALDYSPPDGVKSCCDR